MATKILDKLTETGELTCKENGKAKVYLLNQGNHEVLDKDEMEHIDAEIKDFNATVFELREEVRILSAYRDRSQKSLTNDQMDERIEYLEKDVARKADKLEQLSGFTQLVTPDENKLVQADMDKFLKMWRQRKKWATEMAGMVSEGTGKKLAEVLEDFGCETDQEAGIDISNMGKLK